MTRVLFLSTPPPGDGRDVAAPLSFPVELGFGHRRLSIIDLSAAGHQPMSNEDETVWIVHNGEIYNYAGLREELKGRGHRFRSNTDTEVILHGYEEWGVECLERFNGMWAFAIWDSRAEKLFCSRDRFGIKPFYYHFDGERFLFASEIKALLESGFIERKPNNQTIFDFLAYWAEDCTEDTFFSGIKQLRGGYYLEFLPGEKKLDCRRYYDIPLGYKISGLSDQEYAHRFQELLEDSIRMRLISDVPLGTCLSGGLDSSSIACVIDKLMRQGGVKLPGSENIQKTFSARFDDSRCDEGFFIDTVVRQTAVDAHYTYPTGQGLWEDLTSLIRHQEEPFATTRTYAQWAVYRLARQCGVRIALDGQGGDELLAGYDSYYAALFAYLLRTLRWLNLAREGYFHARRRGRSAYRVIPRAAYHMLPQSLKPMIRGVSGLDGRPCLSKEFTTGFTGYPFRNEVDNAAGANLFDNYLYEVFTFNLLPRLLRHQDKNSMAHSIESRVPFLDYRLVEFAFAMPWDQKIRRGTRKFVLRNAMNGIIPEPVAGRRDKIGFNTPEDVWLRTHLSNEVAEIIHSQSFRQRPYFDVREVERAFNAYKAGRLNIESNIWRWIILESWLRMFID